MQNNNQNQGQNAELDQDVVRLAKSIRLHESSNNPNAKSKDGGVGYYQFTGGTFSDLNRKHFPGRQLNVNDPSHQNLMAYTELKSLKDKGFGVDQIAARWNGGYGAMKNWQTLQGVNKAGVAYDTPKYVNKVVNSYYEMKKQDGLNTPQNQTEVPKMTVGLNSAARQPQDQDGFLKSVGKSIVNPIERLLHTAKEGGALMLDNNFGTKLSDNDQQFNSLFGNKLDYLGFKDNQKLGTTDALKDVGGNLLQVGSNFVPVAKLGTLGKALVGGSGILKTGAQFAKTGAIASGMNELGASMQDQNKSVEDNFSDGLKGVGYGILGAGALGLGGAGASKLGRAIFNQGSKLLSRESANVADSVGSQLGKTMETQVSKDAVFGVNSYDNNSGKFRWQDDTILNQVDDVTRQQATFANTLKNELVGEYATLGKIVDDKARIGNDVIGTTIKNGIVPELIENAGKITQKYSDETITKLNNLIEKRSQPLNEELRKIGTKLNVDEIALETMQNVSKNGIQIDYNDIMKGIENLANDIKSQTKGGEMSLLEANELKKQLYGKIKWADADSNIKSAVADSFSRVIKQKVEQFIPNARELNKEVGDLLASREFIEKFNKAQRIIPYGSRFTKIMLSKGLNSIAKNIPLVGDVASQFVTDFAISRYAKSRYLKGVDLNKLANQSYEPKVYKEMGIVDPAIKSQITNLNKQFFGDENVQIVEQLLTKEGQEALGKYENGMITIVSGKGNIKDTYMHESAHKAIDLFLNPKEKVNLFAEAEKVFGKKTVEELEENISENFIDYAKTKQGLGGVSKAWNRVKKYFSNPTPLTDLYDNILQGNYINKKPSVKAAVENLTKYRLQQKVQKNT